MFEKEIKYINDYTLNKLKGDKNSYTYDQIAASGIHPAIITFISAELDYLIFDDRRKLLQNSIFDYSGSRISELFNDISVELKRTKRISIDDLRKLIVQAISFNVNYLIRPNWALTQLVYGSLKQKSLAEINFLLNYIYYYDHLKNIVKSFLDKKKLIQVNKEDFYKILSNVDRELFAKQGREVIENSLLAISDFFNEGASTRSVLPVPYLIMFFNEKQLSEYSRRLTKSVPGDIKQNISLDEAKDYLFTLRFDLKVPDEKKKIEEILEKKEPSKFTFSFGRKKDEDEEVPKPIVEEQNIEEDNSSKDESIKEEFGKPSVPFRMFETQVDEDNLTEENIMNTQEPIVEDVENIEEETIDIIDEVPEEVPEEIPEEVPEQEVPDKIPEQDIPDEIPDQDVPDEIPGQDIPEESPAENVPDEIPREEFTESVSNKLEDIELDIDIVEDEEEPQFYSPKQLFEDKVEDLPLEDTPRSFTFGATDEEHEESKNKGDEEEEDLYEDLSLLNDNEEIVNDEVSVIPVTNDDEEIQIIDDDSEPGDIVIEEEIIKPDEFKDEIEIEPFVIEEEITEPKNEIVKEKENKSVDLSEKVEDIILRFKPKDIKNIVAMIFDDDREAFDLSIRKIVRSKNYLEATDVLKEIFFIYKVDPYSKQAVKFTNVVEDYFNT